MGNALCLSLCTDFVREGRAPLSVCPAATLLKPMGEGIWAPYLQGTRVPVVRLGCETSQAFCFVALYMAAWLNAEADFKARSFNYTGNV